MKKMTESEKIDQIRQRLTSAESGKNCNSWAVSNTWDYLWRSSANYNVKAIDDTTRLKGNLPMVYIENLCGICMDANIDMLVYPQKPGLDLDAHIYQAIVKWVQNSNNDIEIRDRLHKFAMLGGTSIIKARVEETNSGRVIKYDAIDPKFVRVDPMATNNDDIRWMLQICFYTKDELKAMFPKFDPEINASFDNEVADEVDVWNSGEQKDADMVRIIEMYDVMTGVRTIATGRQVLEEDSDSMSCGLPYVFVPFISAPDRVYGKDLYSELRDMFDEWNKNIKRTADIIAKSAIGTKIISSRYIQPDKVTNEDNSIIIVNTDDVRKAYMDVPPPPMSNMPLDFAKQMEYYLAMIAGVTDSITGQAQLNSNTPAGVSIEKLQQAAQTRVRSYITRLKDIGYAKLAKLIIRMAYKYFNKEQTMRITGTDTETVTKVWERDKQFALQRIAQVGVRDVKEIENGMQIYRMERGISIKKEGANVYLNFTGSILGDPTTFDIQAEGGVDTAHKKLDIANQSMMLFQSGLLDPQTYLEAIDYPLKEKALERSPQWNAFKQWQAQQQQQAQMQEQVQMANEKAKMKANITQKEAQSVQPDQGAFAGSGTNPNDNPNQQLNQ